MCSLFLVRSHSERGWFGFKASCGFYDHVELSKRKGVHLKVSLLAKTLYFYSLYNIYGTCMYIIVFVSQTM